MCVFAPTAKTVIGTKAFGTGHVRSGSGGKGGGTSWTVWCVIHHFVRTSRELRAGRPTDGCYHNLAPQQIQSKSVLHVSDVGRGGQLKSVHWLKRRNGKVGTKITGSGGMVAMCCSIVAFQRAPCIYNETHYCTPAPPSEARGTA